MKHTKLFLLLLAAFSLIACEVKENVTNHADDPNATFDIEKDGLTVTCTSKSEPLEVVSWNMGDGTVIGVKKVVVHTYAKAGTYKIVLTCKGQSGSKLYICTTEVTVTDPNAGGNTDPVGSYKEMYLTGFKLYSVNSTLDSYYVQFQLEGTYLMGDETFNVLSTPQQSLSYLLPLEFKLNKSVLIGEAPNPLDWYDSMIFSVYVSANSLQSQAGDVIMAKYISDPSVMDGYTEYIVSSGSTKVGILFEYRK